MSKRLSYFVALLLLIIAATAVALYAALRSSYATTLVNQAFTLASLKVQVENVRYTPPLQFKLEGVTIEEDSPIYLPSSELWLSAELPKDHRWQLEALVIEGANLSFDQAQTLSTLKFDTKQLALKHTDFTWGELSARNIDVQIENPQWENAHLLPYGNIQFAAEQLYYQGNALNNVLIDLNYQTKDSTLYGASFEWNGAKISGQAEQYPQGWSLINVTVNGLNVSDEQTDLRWLDNVVQQGWIADINSLDLLQSNIHWHDIELLNLDLSIEKINPNQSIWQQDNGYLSFNADTLRYQDEQFVEPSATIKFSSQTIEVSELDSDWQQGRVQLQGQITPNSVQLKSLSLSGVKWLDVTPSQLAQLSQWTQKIEQLSIEHLDISNAQMIQLTDKPFWQVSGLNVEGKQLRLKQDNQLGLWQGSLQLTANSASYAQYLTTQAIIEMRQQNDVWQLNRLFLPLESGYIEASGEWNTQPISAPWQLNLTIDGLPINQELSPYYFEGMLDAHAQLNGLAGDYTMLAHSLSGQVSAALRESHLTLTDSNKKPQFSRDFHVDNLIITADRGRITLSAPQEGQGVELAGKIDLTKPELATVMLQIDDKCQRLQADLAGKSHQLTDVCPQLNSQQSSLESSKAL